jgi:hypothetical protein
METFDIFFNELVTKVLRANSYISASIKPIFSVGGITTSLFFYWGKYQKAKQNTMHTISEDCNWKAWVYVTPPNIDSGLFQISLDGEKTHELYLSQPDALDYAANLIIGSALHELMRADCEMKSQK